MSLTSSRNKALVIWLSAALLAVLLLTYGMDLLRHIRQTSHTWHDYSSRAIQADKALHRLTDNLGYGGFIHDFKNYVLRHDAHYLRHVELHLSEIYKALDDYQALDISVEEREALRTIRRTVDEYAAKVELAKVLVSQGLSPMDIDRRAKVDDAAAVAAISQLEERAEAAELAGRATTHDQVHRLAEQVKYGLVLLLLIVPVTLLMLRDRRQIDSINQELERSRRYTTDLLEAVPDALLVVGNDGRIVRNNVSAQRMLGYSRERLSQMTVEELMPERFRHGHAEQRRQAAEGLVSRPFAPHASFTAQAEDGREIPVDISLSYSRQEGSTQTLVSLRDMTERRRMEARLEQQSEMLIEAQAIAQVGSWDWDIDANTLVWSDEIYRIFGLEPQVFPATYEGFLAYVHPDDRERVQQGVLNAVERDGSYMTEHRVVRPDGAERVVLEKGRVFRNEDGEAVRMVGAVLDITERKHVEQELLFDKAIIDGISQPLVVVDQDLVIVDMNEAYCEMSGYGRAELLGKTPALLKSGRHDGDYYKAMWDSLNAQEKWQGEIWIRDKSGRVLPRLLSITRICEGGGQGCRYVGFYSDITALKESEERLERLAHFDQLTGLANRMLCHDRLRAAVARAHRADRQVAVLYVDLDGFKSVNDRLGHQTGDMLLGEVAKRMVSAVREDDTVARLGGDEFAVILNEIDDRDEVRELAKRLLEKLEITMGSGEAALQVTGSIGIATYPQDGDSVEVLLSRADQAMYQAKQAGKNTFALFDAEAPHA